MTIPQVLISPEDAAAYREAIGHKTLVDDVRRRGNHALFAALADGMTRSALRDFHGTRLYHTTDFPMAFVHGCVERGIPLNDFADVVERRYARAPGVSRDRRSAVLSWLLGRPVALSRHAVVFHAAMPKSASTFLSQMMAVALQRQVFTPHSKNAVTGVEFDLLLVIEALSHPCVLHNHLTGHGRTMAIVNLMGVKPIVQTRNIFDAIVSYSDHIKGSVSFGSHLASLDARARLDIAVMQMAAHLVAFFATWSLRADQIDVHFVDFDTVITSPGRTLKRCLQAVGHRIDQKDADRIAAQLDPKSTPDQDKREAVRFNKGVSGLGLDQLSAGQIDSIRALYREYPTVDFTPIDPGA
jgi:hypothetical protein